MSVQQWQRDVLGPKVVEALIGNEFQSVYFSTREEAAVYILEKINSGDQVGMGGSATLDEIAFEERAAAKGAVILNHNHPGLSAEEKMTIRRRQMICDLFLCSSNAVTLDGCLVNVDGAGNRVAAMTFGPKKVIVVVGTNKICHDIPAAYQRIAMTAAPLNSKRLNLPNPCTEMGSCVDCRRKSRICRIYQVIKRKPMTADFTVVVVGETLGF